MGLHAKIDAYSAHVRMPSHPFQSSKCNFSLSDSSRIAVSQKNRKTRKKPEPGVGVCPAPSVIGVMLENSRVIGSKLVTRLQFASITQKSKEILFCIVYGYLFFFFWQVQPDRLRRCVERSNSTKTDQVRGLGLASYERDCFALNLFNQLKLHSEHDGREAILFSLGSNEHEIGDPCATALRSEPPTHFFVQQSPIFLEKKMRSGNANKLLMATQYNRAS